MKTVRAVPTLNITEALSGRSMISISVGPRFDVVILARGELDTLDVLHQVGGHMETIRIPCTLEPFDLVQPIGFENWLLVRRRLKDPADRNAYLYSASGQFLRSFHAGDGIEYVQATEDGQIWVAFFDEGIFRWPPTEPGPHGLVCFDEYGELTFKYSDIAERHGLPFVDDCYALNVCSNEELWLYYASEFPLVRLLNRRFDQAWSDLRITGSRGFAVKDDYALFAGGHDNRDRLFLVSLVTVKKVDLKPVDRHGSPIKFDEAFGRSGRLYLRSGSILFAVDLGDVVRDLSSD